MPATSAKQKRLFQMAEACQKGEKRACVGPAAKIAATVPRETIREFAKGPVKPRGKRKK